MKTQQEARQIRDLAVRFVGKHEAGAHNGRACITERLNLVAYLCHSLAIGQGHLQQLSQEIAEYDQRCPCPLPEFEQEPCLGRGEGDR